MEYNFLRIEEKWQRYWKQKNIYKTVIDKSRPKYYVLDMFPYPSGAGLHVGHPLGYIASDIYSRYKTLKGFNVLHPMGFDAFGLPAEQYAIETGQHPEITTEKNIKRYREQLDKLGFCYDWDREVKTCSPEYYRWTQWAFIRMFNSYYCNDAQQARPVSELIEVFESEGSGHINAACNEQHIFTAEEWKAKSEKEQQKILMNYRIAYLADTVVNWCPKLGTVLANDEVVNGLSVRGGFPVEQRKMRQWSLRVSAYAQRLLDGLDTLEWTESLKETQKNWIGRSEGAEIRFDLSPNPSPQGRGMDSKCSGTDSKCSGTDSKYSGTDSKCSGMDSKCSGMDSKCSGTDTVSKKTGATEDNPQGYYKHTTDVKNWNLLVNIARDYRSCRTEAENALWQAVRAKKTGYKIRRQHVVNGYIADFINLEKQVIIEVDGGIHRSEEQVEKDNLRTAILNENGFHVIRYTNEEILTDSRAVAYKIKNYLDSVPSKRDDSENCEDISKNPCGDISESSPLPCGEGPGERFKSLTVFTTRPDTIFGVTFMVLAPESEYVAQTVTPEQRAEVEAYIESTKRRTERERIADRKVTGVFSGGYAINPFSGEEVPIWISDYVLAGYGTGAIMAVPAHDSRDYAFAKHFGLPVIPLIEGCDVSEESFDAKEGIMINSGFLNGLTVPEAIERAKEYVEDNGLGVIKVNYRLRDAIFSRQRYWGEPFPVYYKDGMPYNIPEEDLPLVLPEVDKFLPTETGEPPLGRAKNWTYNGYPLEFSTMPGFAGSSAYYLRYMDPHNTEALVSKEADEYWRNVDLYIGGTEHATGHLIYSRFWNKFLYDTGTVVEQEPFRKLVNQGMIQGCSNFVYRVKGTNTFISYGLKDTRDTSALHVDVNIVNNNILDIKRFKQWRPEYEMAEFILEDGEYRCGAAVEKMSKSLYNVVNPDDIVVTYGADTLRLYEMFLGPLEQSKPWDTKGIDGVHRFLRKFWRLFHHEGEFYVSGEAAVKDELKVLHRTIKKVQADIESFSFNTAVSAFMICVNELIDLKCNKKEILEPLTVILSPFAPHIAEELWHLLGNTTSVVKATFPEYDGSFLVENSFEYPISFNGKTRFKIELPLNADTGQIKELVLANAHTQKFLDGRQPKKIIVVSGKIVNIVI